MISLLLREYLHTCWDHLNPDLNIPLYTLLLFTYRDNTLIKMWPIISPSGTAWFQSLQPIVWHLSLLFLLKKKIIKRLACSQTCQCNAPGCFSVRGLDSGHPEQIAGEVEACSYAPADA